MARRVDDRRQRVVLIAAGYCDDDLDPIDAAQLLKAPT